MATFSSITQLRAGPGVSLSPTSGYGPTVTVSASGTPLVPGLGIDGYFDAAAGGWQISADGSNLVEGSGINLTIDPSSTPHNIKTRISSEISSILTQTPGSILISAPDSTGAVYISPTIQGITGSSPGLTVTGPAISGGSVSLVPTVCTLANGSGTTVTNGASGNPTGTWQVNANVADITQVSGGGVLVDKTTTPTIPRLSAIVANVAPGQGIGITAPAANTSGTFIPSLNLTPGLGITKTDGGVLNNNVALASRLDATYGNLTFSQGLTKTPAGDGSFNYAITANTATVTSPVNSGLSAVYSSPGVCTLTNTDAVRSIVAGNSGIGITSTTLGTVNQPLGQQITLTPAVRTITSGGSGITVTQNSQDSTNWQIATDAIRTATGVGGITVLKTGTNLQIGIESFDQQEDVDVAKFVKAPAYFGAVNGFKWKSIGLGAGIPLPVDSIQMNPQFPGGFYYTYGAGSVYNFNFYYNDSQGGSSSINTSQNIKLFGFTGLCSDGFSYILAAPAGAPVAPRTSALWIAKYSNTTNPTTFLSSLVWSDVLVGGNPVTFVNALGVNPGTRTAMAFTNGGFISTNDFVSWTIINPSNIPSTGLTYKKIIPTKTQTGSVLTDWILYAEPSVQTPTSSTVRVTSNTGTVGSYTSTVLSSVPYSFLVPTDTYLYSLRNKTTGVLLSSYRTLYYYKGSIPQQSQIYDAGTQTWSLLGNALDVVASSSDGAQLYTGVSGDALVMSVSNAGTAAVETLTIPYDIMKSALFTACSTSINTTIDSYFTIAGTTDDTLASTGAFLYQIVPSATATTSVVTRDLDIRAEGSITLEPLYDPSTTGYTANSTINLNSDIVNMGTTTNLGLVTNFAGTANLGAVTNMGATTNLGATTNIGGIINMKTPVTSTLIRQPFIQRGAATIIFSNATTVLTQVVLPYAYTSASSYTVLLTPVLDGANFGTHFSVSPTSAQTAGGFAISAQRAAAATFTCLCNWVVLGI